MLVAYLYASRLPDLLVLRQADFQPRPVTLQLIAEPFQVLLPQLVEVHALLGAKAHLNGHAEAPAPRPP